MALVCGLVRLYLELWQWGYFKNIKSMVELGSQEILVTPSDLQQLLESAGLSGYAPERFPHLENFNSPVWPHCPRCPTKPFYELLGVERYTCIDLNEKHGAIRLDLNEPLRDQSLYGQFDLVTDHGCGEHAFNIAEVYRTMHRLCRPGGLIAIAQNVHGEGNGYYNFDVAFYEGLAAANQYRIVFGSYLVTPKSERDLYDSFHIPLSWKLLRTLDWSTLRDVAICYVLQKQHDRDFQIPYQTGLLCERQAHYGFRLQFLPHPPTRTYVPVTDDSLQFMSTRALVRVTLRRIAKRLRERLKG